MPAITPDIVLTAKGIASGMPISAFIAKESVMQWKPGSHGTTYGGNPVCVAAALATLDLIEGGLMANAQENGRLHLQQDQRLAQALQDRRRRSRQRADDRRRKSSATSAPRRRAKDLRDKVVVSAFHKGLLTLDSGENSIRISPPLIIDEEQADCAIRIMEESIPKPKERCSPTSPERRAFAPRSRGTWSAASRDPSPSDLTTRSE